MSSTKACRWAEHLQSTWVSYSALCFAARLLRGCADSGPCLLCLLCLPGCLLGSHRALTPRCSARTSLQLLYACCAASVKVLACWAGLPRLRPWQLGHWERAIPAVLGAPDYQPDDILRACLKSTRDGHRAALPTCCRPAPLVLRPRAHRGLPTVPGALAEPLVRPVLQRVYVAHQPLVCAPVHATGEASSYTPCTSFRRPCRLVSLQTLPTGFHCKSARQGSVNLLWVFQCIATEKCAYSQVRVGCGDPVASPHFFAVHFVLPDFL